MENQKISFISVAIYLNTLKREMENPHSLLDFIYLVNTFCLLQENITLKKLDLSWNGFGDDGIYVLSESLKVNSSIQQLNLRWVLIVVSLAVIALRSAQLIHFEPVLLFI